ncbi:MAG: antitoxin [Rhodococcus sp. (in: high G+C Gram-positive bacteria)]|uniref:antitoxin n=1 Tax=Rhodococcus sp. TaxID=1831 RepID=UPI003BB81184
MAKTQQIAIRLPADLVAFLDDEVGSEHARSRADVVARALRHEQRRLIAERDVAILAAWRDREDPDHLDSLADHASATPLDID